MNTCKDKCTEEFEKWHGFEVGPDADIQTEIAFSNWCESWNTAIRHAASICNRLAIDGKGIREMADRALCLARNDLLAFEHVNERLKADSK